MTLYEFTGSDLSPVPPTTFARADVRERADLQRVLRARIETIAPGCMVLAEEFGDWNDSRLRIDLLCLDREARLVVVELKRNEHGGAMELQALRYAAMVSTMTFDGAVEAHRRFRAATGLDGEAQEAILAHLKWSSADQGEFGSDVRIVLVSADFSKELLTSVLWLNERDLDLRCVRMKPLELGERLLIEIEQVLPLPEVSQFQSEVRRKEQEQRERIGGRDYTKYDILADGRVVETALPKRHAARRFVALLSERGIDPARIEQVARSLGQRRIYTLEGTLSEHAFILEALGRADRGEGAFDAARWFCDAPNLIHFGGNTHAVTNQWGRNLEPFLDACTREFADVGVSYRRSGVSEA